MILLSKAICIASRTCLSIKIESITCSEAIEEVTNDGRLDAEESKRVLMLG